ncbi:MAG: 3'(2'),5'-bisphosphate nucleotidase [Phyllobacteriaceae bacterium]|nr:3'(2'),5'-bisphosphate nucleotidase [Phyllobacteriaceae bacterium]
MKVNQSSLNLSQLIPSLRKIAKTAADAILEVYRQEERFQNVQRKDDNSPLTAADLASNRIICEGLKALPVSYPIISEENKTLPYEERSKWTRCWLVDPLDGTKEFLKRNGEFTINIALVENGRPILGLIHIPVSGECWWAVKGEGAYKHDGKMQQLVAAARFCRTDAGLNIVCSRSHFTGETQKFIEQFKDPNLVSRGSALKFLLIANGDAHVYPRIAPTMEWDTAAAQIIVEEAGGKLVRFDDGKPMVYNKDDLLNPSFVAWGDERC